jgi:chromosome partitioning protein
MQRIVVLNPKGGSGKTTIAVNLAGYYASRGLRPVLMDYDPQGSSGRWVSRRDLARPRVHLISAHERNPRVTRTFQLRPPGDTTHIILDTPAATA